MLFKGYPYYLLYIEDFSSKISYYQEGDVMIF